MILNVETISTEVFERTVGKVGQTAYDSGFAAALKTARSLLLSTNREVTLDTLNHMILIFTQPEEREPPTRSAEVVELGAARSENRDEHN